jgi:tetratricopeptide (TPR) repeat protein
MSKYRFLDWARTGAAASLSDEDDNRRTTPVRGTLSASISIGSGAAISSPVQLHGPGDVLALDQRQIVRVYPLPGTADAETTNFPLVEFDRPDLPWLFTPLAGSPGGSLRPWLALVCVPSQWRPCREAGRPLPVLRAPGSELPDATSLHLWAHAQFIAGSDDEVIDLLKRDGNPNRSISRLLAPRRLCAFQDYVACVVPAFEAGRLAGLREHGEGDLRPAWHPGTDTELPVYFSWEFRTGEPGDFETLADRLRNWPLPESVGRRPMVVGKEPGRFSVHLESALRRPGAVARPSWPFDEVTRQWREGLSRQLSPALVGDDDPDPEVLAPRYGGFHIAREKFDLDEVGWFEALNLDPRWRVAAGLGTRVVQREQERLMASAWQQLADIRSANRFLNLGRFARLLGQSLHRRHIDPLTAEEVLEVSIPLQTRAPRGSLTLRGEVRASGLPDGAATLAYHRTTSPRGRLSRRVAALAGQDAGIDTGGIPFRGAVSALAANPSGLAAPYRHPDGAVAFRVSPEEILSRDRVSVYWKALTPDGHPLASWTDAQDQLAERASRRVVDTGALLSAPDLRDDVLDSTLVLDAIRELETPGSFFVDARLEPDGNVRFPSGHTLPISKVVPMVVDPNSSEIDQLLASAKAWRALARALYNQRQYAEAAEHAERAVEAALRLAELDPDRFLHPELYAALNELTNARHQVGPVEGFLGLCARAAGLFAAQADRFPAEDKRHHDSAYHTGVAWRWAGIALRKHGRAAEAVPFAERAVEVYLAVAELDPVRFDVELSAVLGELAGDRYQVGPVEGFLGLCERAAGLFAAHADRFPQQDRHHRDAAHYGGAAWRWAGTALRKQGRLAEAVPYAERAVQIYLSLAELDPARFDGQLSAARGELAQYREAAGLPSDGR